MKDQPTAAAIMKVVRAVLRTTNGKALSRQAGLNETAVRDILSGKVSDPRLSTLVALAGALADNG